MTIEINNRYDPIPVKILNEDVTHILGNVIVSEWKVTHRLTATWLQSFFLSNAHFVWASHEGAVNENNNKTFTMFVLFILKWFLFYYFFPLKK